MRYGTTGLPVPGYELRIVGDDGRECGAGEIGELQISGPSAAIMYWNNRAKSRHTFVGAWTRSGDKYLRDPDGYYVYCGRSDDMLKVSGIYVSPVEVEAALISHGAVLEAAVIGSPDSDELIKPKAFVVVREEALTSVASEAGQVALAAELKEHVKDRLSKHKYPRWVAFVDELPRNDRGKVDKKALKEREARGESPRGH